MGSARQTGPNHPQLRRRRTTSALGIDLDPSFVVESGATPVLVTLAAAAFPSN
jgi:hypothetical protein